MKPESCGMHCSESWLLERFPAGEPSARRHSLPRSKFCHVCLSACPSPSRRLRIGLLLHLRTPGASDLPAVSI